MKERHPGDPDDPGDRPAAPGQPRTFAYGLMSLQCSATLHPARFQVKQGVRTYQAAMPKLRHLFVHRAGAGTQTVLVLAEEHAPGKNRILRLHANHDDPGFLAFIDAIVAQRPDIDLRGLDEKTALKKMGAVSSDFIGLALMVFVLPAIVGAALLPKLVHGIDFDEDRISIESIAKGKSPHSHNVIITGAHARLDESIEVTTTRTKSGVKTGTSSAYFVPLVPQDWDKSQPVHVILETDEMNSADEAKLERTTKFSGIMRNVLWEGLTDDERDYFENDMGLKLAEDSKLLEHRANPRFDLMVFVGATGLTFLIMLIIAAGIWLRRRLL